MFFVALKAFSRCHPRSVPRIPHCFQENQPSSTLTRDSGLGERGEGSSLRTKVATLRVKNFEEGRPGFTKNWLNEKKHFEKTHIRSIHEELKRAQGMRIHEFSRNEMRESHGTFRDRTSKIQELQKSLVAAQHLTKTWNTGVG